MLNWDKLLFSFRRNTNRENANLMLEKLKEELKLKQFLQDADEVNYHLT